MTTRRTLKDFLNFSGHASVDKLSYDINNPESGVKESVDEGDDLGTDPNTGKPLLGGKGLLGSYLKYSVDKSSNLHKFKEGNEVMPSTNRGSYIQEAHNHGVESSFVDQNSHLKVGDIIAFGTSHPCLTFDKWRYINVIDDNYNVVGIFDTYF